MPLTDAGQIRIRRPLADSESAAADRFGVGCCRQIRTPLTDPGQIRVRLPQTDSAAAADNRFECGCRRQIQIRIRLL